MFDFALLAVALVAIWVLQSRGKVTKGFAITATVIFAVIALFSASGVYFLMKGPWY